MLATAKKLKAGRYFSLHTLNNINIEDKSQRTVAYYLLVTALLNGQDQLMKQLA
jgi:hypothetical protein